MENLKIKVSNTTQSGAAASITIREDNEQEWLGKIFANVDFYANNSSENDCAAETCKEWDDYPKAKAKADFIVTACNSHHDLLHACLTLLSNFKANKMFSTSLTKQELDAGINLLSKAVEKVTQP